MIIPSHNVFNFDVGAEESGGIFGAEGSCATASFLCHKYIFGFHIYSAALMNIISNGRPLNFRKAKEEAIKPIITVSTSQISIRTVKNRKKLNIPATPM